MRATLGELLGGAAVLPPSERVVREVHRIADAARLLQAGVATELHVYPGVFHAGVFHAGDSFGPEAVVTVQLAGDRIAAMRRLLEVRADPPAPGRPPGHAVTPGSARAA